MLILVPTPGRSEIGPTQLERPFFRAAKLSLGYTSDPHEALKLVEQHRNLHCALYEQCLDLAVAGGWGGWSCVRCAKYKDRPTDYERVQVSLSAIVTDEENRYVRHR